ncbi:MAG TPA: hypothetical protein VG605_15460 [Puia sp.]|nr:hypothetical protein [Puia sp.]
MSPLQHRRTWVAYQCAFAVISLMLFTAQLSYKFYEYANRPVFLRAAIHRASGQQVAPGLHNYDHRLILSLDKRYEVQKIVALTAPVLRIPPLASIMKPVSAGIFSFHFSFPCQCPDLRGPPSRT